jgi:hypothetical protein
MVMAQTSEALHPARAIRRFDVFAEYNRQERLEKGDPGDVAKGYGIWIAKVVAARRFAAKSEPGETPAGGHRRAKTRTNQKFRSLGDEPQTDALFDHEIVERMGTSFYDDVFVPAIERARAKGESYEEIRDEIRKDWKPVRSKG